LGALAEIRGGIQKQPKRLPKNNAHPYLRVANVLRGRLDLSVIHQFELFDNELEIYRLVPGDLLIVEGNGSLTEIGRSAIWEGAIEDCVHQNHIIRVRCVEAESKFIDMVWNSPVGAREIAELAVTSAGLYSLSAGKIAAFAIPVPPLEEQREIVRRASELLRLAEAQLARIESVARRVDLSAQATLAKAFRGHLTGGGGEV
jgi:type I restriction enzyme S subunit